VRMLKADPKPITTLRERRDRAELEETKMGKTRVRLGSG
jgi:hypothetical protein